jgi:hypothetical protein
MVTIKIQLRKTIKIKLPPKFVISPLFRNMSTINKMMGTFGNSLPKS